MSELNGTIDKIKISGFKKFEKYEVVFNDGINILIGENEAGKSTILEAINVVLNQKYNNYDKYIIEDILNRNNVAAFLSSKKYENLPKIKIEIFLKLKNIPQNIGFYGFYHSDNPSINNTEESLKYGVTFECCFDEEYKDCLIESIQEGKIPYDFYKMTWTTFSGDVYKSLKKPLRILNIDNSISNTSGAFDYYNRNLYLNKYDTKEIFEQKGLFREKLKEAFNSLDLDPISDNKKFGLNQKKLIMEKI